MPLLVLSPDAFFSMDTSFCDVYHLRFRDIPTSIMRDNHAKYEDHMLSFLLDRLIIFSLRADWMTSGRHEK